MTSWIDRIPEPLMGFVIACGIWFGFNYAVLAERAMARQVRSDIVPACIGAIDDYETGLRMKIMPDLPLGLGRRLGVPFLDGLQEELRRAATPRFLSQAEKRARCMCAAGRQGRSVKFDYAVHTASFRTITPESVGSLRDRTRDVVFAGACGPIPQNP